MWAIKILCKHLVLCLGDKYSIKLTIIVLLNVFSFCCLLLWEVVITSAFQTKECCQHFLMQEESSVIFADRAADLWQLWGSGVCRCPATFLPLFLLSPHPTSLSPFVEISIFTWFWKDSRRSHIRTMPAKHLRKDQNKDYVEEAERTLFKHPNKIKHLGNKGCSKVFDSWNLEGNILVCTVLISRQ